MKKKIQFDAESMGVISSNSYYSVSIPPFLRLKDNEANAWKSELANFIGLVYSRANTLEQEDLQINTTDTQIQVLPPEGTEGMEALILTYTATNIN